MFDIEFAHPMRIPLAGLARLDPGALQLLEEAATQDGVFYLDPHMQDGSMPDPTRQDRAACLELANDLLKSSAYDLLQYDIDEVGRYKLDGYKPMGRNAGVTEKALDWFEAFLISHDQMCNDALDEQRISYPEAIESRRRFLKSHIDSFHQMGQVILQSLSVICHLDADESFCQRHRQNLQSISAFGVLRYPALDKESTHLCHGAHTDVGSITFLSTTDYGLQFQEPTSEAWRLIEPRDELLLVNIGDSLRFMSNMRFRSSLHRVVPFPRKANKDRYSWAYFMRPNYDAEFRDSEGKLWKSIEWHTAKYSVFRAPLSEQQASSILTGKKGYVGLWSRSREEDMES
ncbi:2OG-Fe(II) oxygenase family oxidoreductase [Stachybotrys elegans]|uniref:2OG-Fe(II) oxygenase family oxidoreductase n=1 Tax=Stachybotrys elegans TaxID=80388 RepID=A0A8K0WU18_9HYPO|nr:2OG-Fe(II) oxygenase family oxidoreductase [Stachybotrys elegans]